MKIIVNNLFIALALCSGLQFTSAFAQGTAFLYQGQLQNNGSPANGSYDFTFTLYNASTGGAAVAAQVTNTATSVTNGLFIATIDFGSNAFNGGSRWLEIGIRANGNGTFSTLNPRQPILPAPYSILAGSANGSTVQQNADGAPNLISGSPINVVSNGVVGATIAGGGATNYVGSAYTNSVTGDFGTVGGGIGNTAAVMAVVGGGQQNAASIFGATVSGGYGNTASDIQATVAGGADNVASGYQAAVVGGFGNTASGDDAVVPGGLANTASGVASFAGGLKRMPCMMAHLSGQMVP